MKLIFITLTLTLLAFSCKETNVDELANYRKFYHIKTLTLEEGHPLYASFGGIHHIYANEKAYQSYKTKTKFPEGSLIVFDLLEVQKSENAASEGKRKVLAYMKKTTTNIETGNWEFKAFESGNQNKQIVNDPKNQCFACHLSAEKNDYVFSEWRE